MGGRGTEHPRTSLTKRLTLLLSREVTKAGSEGRHCMGVGGVGPVHSNPSLGTRKDGE